MEEQTKKSKEQASHFFFLHLISTSIFGMIFFFLNFRLRRFITGKFDVESHYLDVKAILYVQCSSTKIHLFLSFKIFTILFIGPIFNRNYHQPLITYWKKKLILLGKLSGLSRNGLQDSKMQFYLRPNNSFLSQCYTFP